ncbi:MAG: exopolysaccharide tyrosine-protein kinase [Chloroflexi bacterium OLB15]|nr:MAG: exopolysaccharide tyrosine-protein kinase [Chloroflexi bacterium OLB15]
MANAKLITLTDPRSSAAEAFRTLRTNLIFSGVERTLTTLVITSAKNDDDKSETIANLAVTFAQSGSKTILVDGDLRNPAQHTVWGVKNDRGLTTMMLEPEAMANPPLVQTEVENLALLPSGALPPVPSDLFSSQRMSEVLGVLKARANYVIFDAPPVLSASDAALLASRLDGILLVVKTGSTRRDQVARARDELNRIHARLLGAVLTNASRADMR